MAGDRYAIKDQHETYFITCTIVQWVDLLTKPVYKEIVIDAFKYCIDHKGLIINGWVIMTNHLHFIARCAPPHNMSDFLRDFKKFTARKFVEAILSYPEARRNWIIERFSFEARISKKHQDYKVWMEDNHAIVLDNRLILEQKLDYIHNNPVKAGIVAHPEDYLYSSAVDYSGNKGLINIEHI